MKHCVPLLGLLMAALTASAEDWPKVYLFDYLGDVNGVSDNGMFAAITDEEQGFAYLWRASAPDDLYDISEISEDGLPSSQTVAATQVYDVTDDGMAVGCLVYRNGHSAPAYYEDGEWKMLPLHPNSRDSNVAIAVTPDGSVIAGYQMIIDPEATSGSNTYPCQWIRQEDGEYDLVAYTNLDYPDKEQQGFFPMTQSPDGKVIGGYIFTGFASILNALVVDGELRMFDTYKIEGEPWEYNGKYYAGTYVDEDGEVKQLWVEDPDDPRIEIFGEGFIDGYKDAVHGEEGALRGFFTNCDDKGNFYGCRTYVENVTEDGEADLTSKAVIYNYLDDTWYTEESVNFFSAGIGEELIFTGDCQVIEGNDVYDIQELYGIEDTDYTINGINKISMSGRTLGGVMSRFNEAIMEYEYYPFIVQTQEELSGLQQIAGSPENGLVIVSKGHIEVANAKSVAIYDMNGRVVSTSAATDVPAGIYVVKAGDTAYKVMVK